MTARKVMGACAGLVVLCAGALAAQTVTAFKTGEQISGMTKQCYYDALGSTYTLTVTVQVKA